MEGSRAAACSACRCALVTGTRAWGSHSYQYPYAGNSPRTRVDSRPACSCVYLCQLLFKLADLVRLLLHLAAQLLLGGSLRLQLRLQLGDTLPQRLRVAAAAALQEAAKANLGSEQKGMDGKQPVLMCAVSWRYRAVRDTLPQRLHAADALQHATTASGRLSNCCGVRAQCSTKK